MTAGIWSAVIAYWIAAVAVVAAALVAVLALRWVVE